MASRIAGSETVSKVKLIYVKFSDSPEVDWQL